MKHRINHRLNGNKLGRSLGVPESDRNALYVVYVEAYTRTVNTGRFERRRSEADVERKSGEETGEKIGQWGKPAR